MIDFRCFWASCVTHNRWNLAYFFTKPTINIRLGISLTLHLGVASSQVTLTDTLTHIANTVIQKVNFEWTPITLFHYYIHTFLFNIVIKFILLFKTKINSKIQRFKNSENAKISIFNKTPISVFGRNIEFCGVIS